jgi:hypothetical protein
VLADHSVALLLLLHFSAGYIIVTSNACFAIGPYPPYAAFDAGQEPKGRFRFWSGYYRSSVSLGRRLFIHGSARAPGSDVGDKVRECFRKRRRLYRGRNLVHYAAKGIVHLALCLFAFLRREVFLSHFNAGVAKPVLNCADVPPCPQMPRCECVPQAM